MFMLAPSSPPGRWLSRMPCRAQTVRALDAARLGDGCPFPIELRQSRLISGIRCYVPLDLMHSGDDAVGYLQLV